MSEDYTLVITRTFNAPRQNVWDAWTKKEELEKWFGPEDMNAEFSVLDFKVGGAYKFTMRNKDGSGGEHDGEGVFETIEEPSKLVYSFQWTNGVSEYKNKTTITIELKEVAGGTEMVFTHAGFESEQQKIDHNKGWSSSFNDLASHLG